MNERAIRRLEIARRLLGLEPEADVMRDIEAMPVDERERLRGWTDWVEQYEHHEAEFAARASFEAGQAVG